MCLLAFCWNHHPTHPLIVAANRDEFYDRPTAPAHFWDDAPHVLAGRDQSAGGTWMGITRTGRWAALTNVRNPEGYTPTAPSRGHLVSEYLTASMRPRAYLEQIAAQGERYNGFNLLVGTPNRCLYYSNHDGVIRTVSPGTHGLSNHLLDTAWPKVDRATRRLNRAVTAAPDEAPEPERLFDLLDDRNPAPDDALPDTGVGLKAERMLSPPFIESPDYGTRSSTVLLLRHDGHVRFVERTFDEGMPAHTRSFAFDLVPVPPDVHATCNE